MLRVLLVLLLAANALWWAATHGWLPSAWLPLPDEEAQREPQRLARQLRPEAISVLPATPPGAAAPRAAAPVCLQSAVLADDALTAAEGALEAAGIAPARLQRLATADGTVLRVEDASAGEQEALRAAAALAAGGPGGPAGPAFSPCP